MKLIYIKLKNNIEENKYQLNKKIEKITNKQVEIIKDILLHPKLTIEIKEELNIIITDYINNNYFNDLKNNYNLYDDYFKSTILLFKTGIIKNDTVLRLIELMNTYPIGDGDQAYMNLYFINNWKPIPIKDEVGFLYDWWKRDNNKETDYVMLKY